MKLEITNEEGVKAYSFKELMIQYDVRESDGMLYEYLTSCIYGFGEHQIEWNDYSTLDCLYLLKQLREYAGGNMLISLGGLNERKYNNCDGFVESLIDSLCNKIKKMIVIEIYDSDNDQCVKVGYDDLSRLENQNCVVSYWLSVSINNIYDSPKIICQTKENLLSNGWVNSIIHIMEEDKKYYELMLGKNIKGTKTRSRLPHLGLLAMGWLYRLPDRWTQTDKLCFLADLLKCHGDLDFKGKIFLDGYCNMTRKEKSDMVKSWLESYDRLRNKMQ